MVTVREESYDPASADGRRRIAEAPHRTGARSGPPGFTEYVLRPRWWLLPDPQGCHVDRAETAVDIVIRIPVGVSDGVERWLRRHEDGHRRLTEDHARMLHDRLVEERSNSCAALDRRITAILEGADEALRAAHARWDGAGDPPGDGFPESAPGSSFRPPGA